MSIPFQQKNETSFADASILTSHRLIFVVKLIIWAGIEGAFHILLIFVLIEIDHTDLASKLFIVHEVYTALAVCYFLFHTLHLSVIVYLFNTVVNRKQSFVR